MRKHATMPCGWGCGEQLTARTIRSHFTNCPRRDNPSASGLMASQIVDRAAMSQYIEDSERDARKPEPRMIQGRGPVKMMVDDFGGPLDGRKCGCRGQQVCDVCQSVFRETVLVPLEEM